MIEGHQVFNGPKYSLGLVDLEILKTYIKTNLDNSFVKSSKSPTGSFLFLSKS